jgi:hypothetical protein
MRRWTCLLTVVVVVVGDPLLGAGGDPPASKKIDLYIALLGSKEFAQRQQATDALLVLGGDALPALYQAAAGKDAEVGQRARMLITKIENKLQAAQVLAPKKVHLVFKDTPLPEAVAALAKQSGYAVQLHGEPGQYANRPVTLDTGETTFLQALSLLCEKAGLTPLEEKKAEDAPKKKVGGTSVIVINKPVKKTPKDILKPLPDQLPRPMILGNGKFLPAPAHFLGAVCLGVEQVIPGPADVQIKFKVLLEPGLYWEDILGLRIDKVLDEHSQKLAHEIKPFQKAAVPVPVGGGGNNVVVINGKVVGGPATSPKEKAKELSLRLLKADKLSTKLKELSGVVFALIRGPTEDLVVVDKVLQAKGKKIVGKKAGSVEVFSVAPQPGGLIKLELAVEFPARTLTPPAPPPLKQSDVIINGVKTGGNAEELNLSALNFALLDNQGKPFQIVSAWNTGKGSPTREVLELVFQPQPGTGEPMKLIYSDRRTVPVEIPFAFKDLALANPTGACPINSLRISGSTLASCSPVSNRLSA